MPSIEKDRNQMVNTAVLLINLGTPDDPSTKSVRRYLKEFLLDKRVIDIPWLSRQLLVRFVITPFRAPKSAKLYQELWTENGSPIKYFGNIVKAKLQAQLPENYVVELGMRYKNPSIELAVNNLMKHAPEKLIVIPLFPQYASASTGSAIEKCLRILSSFETIPELAIVNSFYNNPKMIDVICSNAQNLGLHNYDHFLFSFHGIPQRQLIKSDCNDHCLSSENCCQSINENNALCYSAQCYATANALVENLGLEATQFSIGFQSRLGKAKWTEPFTPDVLKRLYNEGKRKLMVFSPSFVADCLETTVEIGVEYKTDFLSWGGERLDLVPSLNDNDTWIESLKEMVFNHS